MARASEGRAPAPPPPAGLSPACRSCRAGGSRRPEERHRGRGRGSGPGAERGLGRSRPPPAVAAPPGGARCTWPGKAPAPERGGDGLMPEEPGGSCCTGHDGDTGVGVPPGAVDLAAESVQSGQSEDPVKVHLTH